MLEAVRAIGDPQPQHQHETQIIASYSAFLSEICEKLAVQPSYQRAAHEFIVERIPPFIYMDEFRAFTGTALLDQVQQRYKSKALTEEDETLLMIMNLSGLDLDEEVKKSNSEDCKQRQYDLDDASMALNQRIDGHWRQRKYDVQFRADGQYFYTMVKDARQGSGLIPLEERSKGFQWFFSFDLLLMHESEGTFENCIILLDEPGLHLHSEAQQDLLQRLETYAKGNTLIYTTHLPFMLNLDQPERIRIISERADGTAFVTEDLSLSTAGEKLTLQSALCMQGSTSQNVAQKNLVVDGVDNYMIISALSDLIWRSGKQGIPDDIFLTAAQDARGAVYMTTLMIGQTRDVLAIFDANYEGRAAEEQLREQWLCFYKAAKAKSILLAQVAGLDRDVDFAIENLFADNFYLQKVNEVYGDQIKAAGVNILTLKDEGLLCDRVAHALQECGIERFDRSLVAKRIRAAIVSMKSTGELSKESRDKAEQLIMEIVQAFPKVSEPVMPE
jgi:predicted ATPase